MRVAIYGVFVAIGMVLLTVPVANAQYGWQYGPGWFMGPGWHHGPGWDHRWHHSLHHGYSWAYERCADVWESLSADQKDKITSIQRDYFKKQGELYAQLRSLRRDMLEYEAREKDGEETLKDLRKKMWDVEDKLTEGERALDQKLLAVLSIDERKKLGALEPSSCLAYDVRRGAW